MDCYDYVRRTYGVPAYVGMRVRLENGTEGVIVKATSDLHYIHVRIDGRKFSVPCHPTDHVTYLVEGAQLTMPRRHPVEIARASLTVQPSECEEFVLVPMRLLTSLKDEIDSLRAQCGLPPRVWEATDATR